MRRLPLAVLGTVLLVHGWLALVVIGDPRLAAALLPMTVLFAWAAARGR